MPKTGNRFIDTDHARLASLIRNAAQLARRGQIGAEFLSAVRDFRALLGRHFSIEEVIVGGAGFDSLGAHQRRHEEILGEIDAIIASFEAGANKTAHHLIVDHMEQVLFDHEIVEDTQYWEFLSESDHDTLAPSLLMWKPEYQIGADWVDDQHRTLMEMLAKIIGSAGQPNAQEETARMLDIFIAYAGRHFADEEAELAALGRPVTEHRLHHQNLLTGLADMAAAAKAKPDVLASDYLVYWLLDHIRGVDRTDFAPT